MKKLLVGALAAASLAFAGCERTDAPDAVGGSGVEGDQRFGNDGRIEHDLGAADPREHEGLDGSGPESTFQDHEGVGEERSFGEPRMEGEQAPPEDYDRGIQSEGGAVPQ